MDLTFLTNLKPEIFIQGGAALVATLLVILLIYIVKKHADTDKNYFNHTNSTLKEVAKSNVRVAVSHTKMANSIDKLSDIIDKKIQ